MATKLGLLVLCGTLFLPGCASKGDEMRIVVPSKTTYLHAEAVDGGLVDVPPRVLEEVRPTVPEGIGNGDLSPSVVLRFTIDANGKIADIDIARATDDGLADPAVEAISLWRVSPALRDGKGIAVVATVQLIFDPPAGD